MKGIGIDIVDIRRLNVQDERLVAKVLSDEEIEVFNQLSDRRKAEFLAGRFAVKEALYKAGCRLGFKEVTCLNDETGKPYLNIENTMVSISHEKDYCTAMVVIE
ncbi:MAG: holo-ACP synthase [Erysipelotrichaceae bacterium]|nr:holo-ACP synthase [Erysipelotrichaceae bacterium]